MKGLQLIIVLLMFSGTFFVRSSSAQEGARQDYSTRELELSQQEEKNSYRMVQERTITKFKKLLDSLHHAESATPMILDKYELNYLSAMYFYCSLQSGECTFLLDGLLENELVMAVQSGDSSCPNMKEFWRRWVGNDMERRMEHEISIGYISRYQQFKKKDRPRYIKCPATVQGLLKASESPATLLSKRYAEGSPALANIEKTLTFITEAAERIPNIFGRIGVRK